MRSATRTNAIVLRRTNYGEADRIVRLITPEGCQTVMARGVRREKSKLAGGIELFAVSDVTIQPGKGEMGTLTAARLVHFYRHILTDYERMQFGYEAVKQVARGSDMIGEPAWYEVLAEVLPALDTATIPLQLIEIWFYLRCAALLGYELDLQFDRHGQPLDATRTYAYDVIERSLYPTDGSLDARHIKLLRLVAAKPIAAIARIGGVESILSDCRYLVLMHMRGV